MVRLTPLILIGGCCLPGSMKDRLEERVTEAVVEKAIEQADGVKDVEITPDGVRLVTDDGTVVAASGDQVRATGTGDKGAFDVAIGEGSQVPAGFPIPIYPGSTVVAATSEAAGVRSVTATTHDPLSAVLAFYDAAYPSPTSRTLLDDGAGGTSLAILGSEVPGFEHRVSITPGSPDTGIVLVVAPR